MEQVGIELKKGLFYEFLSYILKTFKFYKKTYSYILSNKDGNYLEFSEKICSLFLQKKENNKSKCYIALDGFIEFSCEYLRLQQELIRYGKYRYSTQKELKENVYSKKYLDSYYLDSIFLSQIFWVNHYKIIKFFKNFFITKIKKNAYVLDVPSGTGVFSMIVKENTPSSSIDLIDLNESALKYSKEVLELSGNLPNCSFHQKDIFEIEDSEKYDFIICGELLEHVEKPGKVLEILAKALKKGGYMFVTTAVYCAAADHIYLFNTIKEVKNLINHVGGLNIVKEIVLPLSLENHYSKDKKEALNMALILKKV